jgi:ATP-dependent Clp protease ATP-binding subunit ClpB
MTSNLGSQFMLSLTDESEIEDKVLDVVRDHFKPEFLNRVDEIIVFHRLSMEHLEEIVTIQLQRLIDRLAERKLELRLTDAARRHLAERGYDPAYGARPLKRLIQRGLENELALKLLDGTFREGDVIEVDTAEDALVFRKVAGATAA